MVKFFKTLLGLGLLLFGIYLLGKNIIFTTNIYPYWWRGIAADASILLLTGGITSFFVLPETERDISWILVVAAIVLVFMSSRAILNPTSLWEFFVSVVAISGGYQLMGGRRSPL